MTKKPGLWANIHAKQERIKHGSGEHMRKPGSKGAPTKQDFINSQTEEFVDEKTNPFSIGRTHRDISSHIKKLGWSLERNKGDHEIYSHPKSQNKIAIPRHKGKDIPPGTIRDIMSKMNVEEQYTGSEKVSKNSNDPSSRFKGTDSLTNVYKKETPGQVVKRVIKEVAAWQRKEGKNPEGGLNKKGVESYRKEHPGSHLQTAVTTKPSKLEPNSKAAKRRKSFCARMKGMKARLTSAETARDPDSRINKSLRKWNC
jgi:predicted RNA binding protein YcfA (HicA-like mRNA interferase family)